MEGLTQMELSRKSGVHRCLISFFETGFRTPNLSHKRRLSGALRISMREIWPERSPAHMVGTTLLTSGKTSRGLTSHLKEVGANGKRVQASVE